MAELKEEEERQDRYFNKTVIIDASARRSSRYTRFKAYLICVTHKSIRHSTQLSRVRVQIDSSPNQSSCKRQRATTKAKGYHCSFRTFKEPRLKLLTTSIREIGLQSIILTLEPLRTWQKISLPGLNRLGKTQVMQKAFYTT